MARTPRKPVTFNRVQETFYRQNFLQVVNARCPEVLQELRDKLSELCTFGPGKAERTAGWEPDEVRFMHPNTIAPLTRPIVKQWATRFHVSGTWIEDQCNELALIWILRPDHFQGPYLPFSVQGPEFDLAHELVVRIPIPHEMRWERAYFRWDTLQDYFRSQLPAAFERELDKFRQSAVRAGVIDADQVPDELDTKMAVVALYLFRKRSPEQIAAEPGFARDRTVLNRWIKEVTRFLDLEIVRRRRLTPK